MVTKMNWLEIVLLIVGAGLFIASFIIPEKNENDEEPQRIDEGIIKALIEKEFAEARERVVEVVDETLEYAVEKTERASERVSNEKIMAISDYSETVLADINKAHQEVMFLYDMLNDKHNNIKETVKQVDKTAKEAEAAANAAAMAMSAKSQQEADISVNDEAYNQTERRNVMHNNLHENIHEETVREKTAKEKEQARRQMARLILPLQQDVQTANTTMASAQVNTNELKPLVVKNVEIIGNNTASVNDTKQVEVYSFAQQAPRIDKEGNQIFQDVNFEKSTETAFNQSMQTSIENEDSKENNNDKILKLHKKGMSNVDIAKELGLGVGEVKLVINLFKGAM